MRKNLIKDFTQIYHIDLHGNVRQNPKLSGTTHNVFGIQVGVGITIAVRSAKHSERRISYHRVPENWRKEEKLAWLAAHSLNLVDAQRLTPNPQPLSPITGEGEQAPDLALKSRPVIGEGFREGSSGFRAFADSGRTLADLHLNYETVAPYKLRWIEAKNTPLSYHVEKMRLSKDKTQLVINESLTLADIPPEAFAYRLGNRSALEWVIDQYQVTTDKRSGIISDPNREDEPRYIVDLVGRVIQVSVETVRIVAALPIEYSSASVIEPSMSAPQ